MFSSADSRPLPDYAPGFPICIDLDGTLVKEHTIWHLKLSLWAMTKAWIRTDLNSLFPTVFWPSLKTRMADAAEMNQARLTYHTGLLVQMQRWHRQGVALYLVTGAPEKIARHVADGVGLFTDVWSSSAQYNLVGDQKGDLLRHRFGPFGYTYVGDSWKDVAIWKTSVDVICVAKTHSALAQHLKKTIMPPQGLFFFPHDTKATYLP
jgi:phosphoserine phosphatase